MNSLLYTQLLWSMKPRKYFLKQKDNIYECIGFTIIFEPEIPSIFLFILDLLDFFADVEKAWGFESDHTGFSVKIYN